MRKNNKVVNQDEKKAAPRARKMRANGFTYQDMADLFEVDKGYAYRVIVYGKYNTHKAEAIRQHIDAMTWPQS